VTRWVVLSSAPLRLSLAGGGSDLPGSSVRTHLVAVALDRRVSVAVVPRPETVTARMPPASGPSTTSLVGLFAARNPRFAVSVISHTPVAAGLGGSGALSVALVNAERFVRGRGVGGLSALMAEAWRWERELLRRPVGYQDQAVAVFGGCVEIEAWDKGRQVRHRDDLAAAFEWLGAHHLLLVDTGVRHDAAEILRGGRGGRPPAYRTDPDEVAACLVAGDWRQFARILNRQWAEKKRANLRASSPEIDRVIDWLRAAGVEGFKLVGAGGGGFLLCCMDEHRRDEVERRLAAAGRPNFRPVLTRTGAELTAGGGAKRCEGQCDV